MMLPTLPGIQELVNLMRSDVSEYVHPDVSASSGLRYGNDFADPDTNTDGVERVCSTLAGQAYGTDTSLPDVVRDSTFHPTEAKPDVITSGLHEFPNFTMNSSSFSENQTIQTSKPVYTTLTSKNVLHSTKPNTRSCEINELSNSTKTSPKPIYTVLTSKAIFPAARPSLRPNSELMNTGPNELSSSIMNSTRPSEIYKTPPKPSYVVLSSNTMFQSARSSSNPINTGPNEPSKPFINQRACYPANSKFQKILPRPVYTKLISNTNTKCFPARAKPRLCTSPLLYQLLKVNTLPSTASVFVTSETPQLTSPNPIDPVPKKSSNLSTTRSNPTSSMLYQLLKPSNALNSSMTSDTPIASPNPINAVPTSNTGVPNTREDHFQPTGPNRNLPNSGLNTLPKSNSSYAKSYQQNPTQVTAVPSIKHPQSSSSSKRQNCCTKSVIKASKRSSNRKSTSKRVKSCVPAQESSCDGSLNDVKVKLTREELWKIFYDHGNEMIVVKHGRPMFPALEVDVSGLAPEEMYSISARFICVDKYRYHFCTSLGIWEPTIEDRHQPEDSRCFQHPASPANGQNWSEKPLAFTELRLTNHATKAENMVYVPTLRKHRIQLVVTMPRCSHCQTEHTRDIDIQLTEFIAVSSYYSLKVTQLKIAHNPMAKTRCKNKSKRKNCNDKSPEETRKTKKQKSDEDPVSPASTISETNLPLSTLFDSSDSTHVSMLENEHPSTTTSTQLSPDLNTSSILQSTSNSQLPTILSFVSPSVPQSTSSSLNILPSTSSSQLPPISSEATIISSTSSIKPAKPFLSSPTSTYPQPHVVKATGNPKMYSQKEQCNTVYTCQTTKPTAHVQTDEDILAYIKIYLSPFLTSEKNEAFDSSVFDELFNTNYISEKLESFDNLNLIST